MCVQVKDTFDLIVLLNNSHRTLHGFSLLQNLAKPTEPNKGSDEVLHQLHASLKRANEFYYEPESQLIGKNETFTAFLRRQYG